MKKIFFLIPLFFIGCFTSQPKIVFVKTKCDVPNLYIFRNDTSYSLTYKEINNKVCIKEWNTCIPNNQFDKLIIVLSKRNKIIKKYQTEILLYQKFKRLNKNLNDKNTSKSN